jgi:hypothetical protein
MDHRPNVKPKTGKLLEDDMGENPHDLWLGKCFLHIMPKVRSIEDNMDELYFIKIKNLHAFKDTINCSKYESSGRVPASKCKASSSNLSTAPTPQKIPLKIEKTARD